MNLKEIGKTTLNLVIFCAVVGFLLSFYNQVTQGAIKENKRKEILDVQKSLLPADEYRPIDNVPDAWKAVKGGKFAGYIVKTEATGYSSTDKIVIMYSVGPDFKVTGVNVVSNSETPGLGTRIDESIKIKQFGDKPFVSQFVGKKPDFIRLGSSSKPSPDSIAAITGATVSCRGVTKGIHDSLENLLKKLKEGKDAKKPVSSQGSLGMEPSQKPLLGGAAHACNGLPHYLHELLPADSYTPLYPGAFEAVKGGQTAGFVATGEGKGYHNPVNVAVALDPGLKIIKVKVLSHKETPAYFEKLESSGYLKRFEGRKPGAIVFAEKKGSVPGGIDAITGATYSCKAVFLAVKESVSRLSDYLKNKAGKSPG
jgi:electron transport complex protein RnfG